MPSLSAQVHFDLGVSSNAELHEIEVSGGSSVRFFARFALTAKFFFRHLRGQREGLRSNLLGSSISSRSAVVYCTLLAQKLVARSKNARNVAAPFCRMRKKTATLAILSLVVTSWVSVASPSKLSDIVGLRLEGVKTTAYSANPVDNGDNDAQNALGKPLKSGRVTSAAADWSRYPVGTRFRIVETGQEYIVDDYGSALVGTGTIDLYKRTDAQVDRWGVRHVTIEILEWGSPERSLRILEERGKMRHIQKMVRALREQESV